jgi:Metallo-beta-lactamase superfamily
MAKKSNGTATRTRSEKTSARSRGTRPAVRVRMYRQGLGDCFLLSFPKKSGGEFLVLIDCGVILGTPNAADLMKAVAQDILKTTSKKIDVLVATHEHWDHVSGFDQAKDEFEKLSVRQVWLAWTENPHDELARSLREERAHRLAALWLGVGQLQQRLAANSPAQMTLDQAAGVLSFFGIDVEQDQPPAAGFGAAAAAAGGRTGAAMKWVREKTPSPKFWMPGDMIDLTAETGVRVYVLGPPRNRTQLFKDLPTRKGRETYEEAKTRLAATERAFFAGILGANGAGTPQTGFDPSSPFDAKYRIPPADAHGLEFFCDHYFGSSQGDAEAWRRIESEWASGAAELALQLDSDTNNTSLALAFELPDGRVLLFPGDAQVGNWESWHDDGSGKTCIWKAGQREITAEALLNRTVLYKVGHHGSHNATLREKGLEMMTSADLVAMVPVDVYVAHKKKHWMRMPFNPLMTRLADVTHGRLVQADQTLKALSALRQGLKPFLAQATDAREQLEVIGEDDKPGKRPLYVEYSLPAV